MNEYKTEHQEQYWYTPYQTKSSDAVLADLQMNGGENVLMNRIIEAMLDKLSEARAAYFRRPSASMPFGASSKDSAELIKLHPEVREIIFETTEAVEDAVYLGCKHLAVKRCLMQLLRADSEVVGDPFAHQILLDGVYPHEHDFVFRTQVPMVDIATDVPEAGARHFIVADLTRSSRSLDQLIRYSDTAEAAELMVVVPYDPGMWELVGGQQLAGSYTYQWVPPTMDPIEKGKLVKSHKLPKGFFSSPRYSNWKLLVQPYGSVHGFQMYRSMFMTLFAGDSKTSRYVETRIVRNGFAEVSFIQFKAVGPATDSEVVARRERVRAIPVGSVEIPSSRGVDYAEWYKHGRQYDLSSPVPMYVKRHYFENALQQFYTIPMGRQVVPAMMRHLHANSARLVYNGAVITSEQFVDLETMCSVLEYIGRSNAGSRKRMSMVTAQTKGSGAMKPKDYAANLARWIALKAVDTADVQEGLQQVAKYLTRSDAQPTEADGTTHEERDPMMVYGEPSLELDPQKDELMQIIADHSTSMFNTVELPYTIEREDIQVPAPVLFDLRMDLMRYSKLETSVAEVQSVYDVIFPGNSMNDPTVAQAQSELGDVNFIIDVQYFRVSIPALFTPLQGYQVIPSLLRTSIGADLMASFRSLMASLMKRNFNRPRPEAPGDRLRFVQGAVDRALRAHARQGYKVLLAQFARDTLDVSNYAISLWTQSHSQSDALAAVALLTGGDPDPSAYRLMPKDVPKPGMSRESQGAIYVGQTVVFHPKDVIALTAGVFTILIQRLVSLFDTNIRLAFGADEHKSGLWADKYLDMPGVYVYEIDVPKFDKSQDWAVWQLILHVMSMLGVSDRLLQFWRKASEDATVFNATFHLVFHTMFGNRSGSAATLATNCIALLFAYLDTFSDLSIVAMLLKGDDSVLVTRKKMTPAHEVHLQSMWGFSMKLVNKPGAVSFCSSVFVKDMDDRYQLVRDVVRVIEKFGRALSVNKPASYFLDYYVSVVDTARSYDDPVIVANLTKTLSKLHGVTVDAHTLCRFVQYVSSSSETFLHVLYGLPKERIKGIQYVDDALETLRRARSVRFTKAKGLVDLHSELKHSFLDTMKLSFDWPTDAAGELRNELTADDLKESWIVQV